MAWVVAYIVVFFGTFALFHHFDHTHVASNYSIVPCSFQH